MNFATDKIKREERDTLKVATMSTEGTEMETPIVPKLSKI